jgi:protein phosphatase
LWPHLFVVHAGDSSCYLLRDQSLRQITLGAVPARHLGGRPGVDPKTEAVPRPTEVLTTTVEGGEGSEVEPDVHRLELVDRDALLLCSNALTEAVPEETIGRLMVSEGFANARCHALLEAVEAAGRRDDTTVVVASFGDFEARLKSS